MDENVHRINMHLSAFTLVTDLESMLKTAYKSLEFFKKSSFLKFEPLKEEIKEKEKTSNKGFFGKVKGGLKRISIGGLINKFTTKKHDRFSNVKLDLISIGKDECEVEEALKIVDLVLEDLRKLEGEQVFDQERIEAAIDNLRKIRLD